MDFDEIWGSTLNFIVVCITSIEPIFYMKLQSGSTILYETTIRLYYFTWNYNQVQLFFLQNQLNKQYLYNI
jgi:hypothetical protein